MISDESLIQVWCESQDDATLIWSVAAEQEVEFVQVKSHQFGQLWSIAKLLEKEKLQTEDGNGEATKKSKKKEGYCILEKSLQFDRCTEKVRFRIVTSRPVMDELNILTYELGSTHRDKLKPEYVHLLKKTSESVGTTKSENGNGCEFWLERTFWVVVHSQESVRDANLLKLAKLAQLHGQLLMVDQVQAIYERILTKVRDAGLAAWDREPDKKRIIQSGFRVWFGQAVDETVHPSLPGAGKALEGKLADAAVATDLVESAGSMRRHYMNDLLTPKYSAPGQRAKLEGTIEARLMTLRALLDGGEIADDGPAFIARCHKAIDEIHNKLPEKERPPIQNLYGYMYNLADRCTHRFVRAKA